MLDSVSHLDEKRPNVLFWMSSIGNERESRLTRELGTAKSTEIQTKCLEVIWLKRSAKLLCWMRLEPDDEKGDFDEPRVRGNGIEAFRPTG